MTFVACSVRATNVDATTGGHAHVTQNCARPADDEYAGLPAMNVDATADRQVAVRNEAATEHAAAQ